MTADTALLMADLLADLGALEGGASADQSKPRLRELFAAAPVIGPALNAHVAASSASMRARFFGRARARLVRRHSVMVASADHQHLCLSFGMPINQEQLRLKGDVLFLDVADEHFTLTRRERNGARIVIKWTPAEIREAIAFHGSIWATIFPAHHALIVETSALTLRSLGGTFLLDEGRSIEARLGCFANPYTRLQTLDDMARATPEGERGPHLLAERSTAGQMFRKYGLARSSIFDFGSDEQASERDDFVTTYDSGPTEQHHEFAIAPKDWATDAAEWRLACFDLLNMLAVRRAKLFRSDFGSRVFNLMFPPLLLAASDGSGADLALFPTLNLYRGQERGFRRTASLSFTIVPVSRLDRESMGCRARMASLRELYRLKDALDRSALAAASSDRYEVISLAKGYYRNVSGESHLSVSLQAIARDIARRVYGDALVAERDAALEEMIYHARAESRMTTLLLQVGWQPRPGDAEPWEGWLAGNQDEVFADALYRTMFYKDFLFPDQAYASRRAIQLREFNIGNTLGADMTGMTLFNPQDRLKFCLYSQAFEAYPNYSILRWATWQVYIDSALTSMRALIFKFHPLMDTSYSLHAIMNVLRRMIHEFVEFYDLDIREYFYRKEYEKLRERFHIEADYRQLQEKFSAAKEDELLREQRLINKLIMAFTIATVVISVISTIAQMNQIKLGAYLLWSVFAVGVLTPLGYLLFDPVRELCDNVVRVITRRWRRRHDD